MVDTAATANLLGDPTRVRILDALTSGPMRTAELAAATGMTPAALSRHLNLLRKAEVIARMDVADDGRGRAYALRPAALNAFSAWLRSTSWAGELAAVSIQPQTRELLTRMGGFLDAFAASDTAFFESHLHPDAVLVFPGMSHLVDKQGCIDSVASHPPYRRHQILTEPVVRLLGAATTVITVAAEVATAADETARPTFITAIITEGDPWQLAHLQWTPAAPTRRELSMTDLIDAAPPTRVVAYAHGADLDASRGFYTEVLGFDVAMEDPVLGLTSPANHNAQVLIPPAGFEDPQPRFGVDLGNPEAVDTAHAAAVGRGLRIVYPLTDEAWGVRRFFVEDPGGTVVNVLAHTAGRMPNIRPRLVVEDVDVAVAYYQRYLGAVPGPRHAEPSGYVGYAEVRIGNSTITLHQAYDDYRLYSPESASSSPVLLTLTVDDASAVGAAMVEGGGTVIVSIEDRPWGRREGRIRDPFGHLWVISQDLTPAS